MFSTITCIDNLAFTVKTVNGDFGNGCNINLSQEHGEFNQIFSLTDRGDGYYSIDLDDTDYVLDIQAGVADPGTNVILYRYNGGKNQLWRLEPIADSQDTFFIKSKANMDMALDVDYASDPYNLIIWNFHGGENQRFKIDGFGNEEERRRKNKEEKKFKVELTERTFIAVKPDGVQRGLVGDIIARFEKRGYKLVAMKLCQPGKEHLEQHYSHLKNKPFFPSLVKYMNSGPICAMVWEGLDVVRQARAMLGETNPCCSATGTIRGDFGVEISRNVCHGSDAVDTAEREIAHWFYPEEFQSWESHSKKWIYE